MEVKSIQEVEALLDSLNQEQYLPIVDLSNKEEEFDIGTFNRKLIQAQENFFLNGFGIKAYNKIVYVDLTNGKITIDNIEKDLQLPDELKQAIEEKNIKLRFINFKRHIISKRMGGDIQTHHIAFGIGWQTTLNEKNYQRFILLYPNGNTYLMLKR